MMKKTLVCLVGLTVCALGANAQLLNDDSGFYIAGRGAYTMASRSNVNGGAGSVKFKDGFDVGAAIGFKVPLRQADGGRSVPMALRLELDGGYGENRVKSVSAGGIEVAGAGGHLEHTRILTNLLLDVPLFDSVYLTLGGGVGWVRVHGHLDAGGLSTGGTSDRIGYQGIVSVGVALTEAVQLEVGYRAFSYSNPSFGGGSLEAPLVSMFGASLQLSF